MHCPAGTSRKNHQLPYQMLSLSLSSFGAAVLKICQVPHAESVSQKIKNQDHQI